MSNPFQSLLDFFAKLARHDNGRYANHGADARSSIGEDSRPVFTALDIGTAYAKAIIIEVQDDVGVVLGAGRHQQSYSHMSDGIVTDIPGVIANCNEALTRAEQSAGGIIAPQTVIGIAGELVKGSSITITKQRQDPTKEITPDELENAISTAQSKLHKAAKERIATEIGYSNVE